MAMGLRLGRKRGRGRRRRKRMGRKKSGKRRRAGSSWKEMEENLLESDDEVVYKVARD